MGCGIRQGGLLMYGLWYGGGSYSVPYVDDDIEWIESFDYAISLMRDRYYNRDNRTPAVDDRTTMQVFSEDPRGVHDPYPDQVIYRDENGEWAFNPGWPEGEEWD